MHSGYFDCLLAANAVPVIIPPLIKEHDLAPILDKVDGVMLTGGDDLDPKKMGLAPHRDHGARYSVGRDLRPG
jgi:putative glutamine amidotransferase